MAAEQIGDIIDNIDKGMAKYYTFHGREDYFDADKIGKFRAYCNECAFESGDVEQELNTDPNDCMITEFDDEFPGIETNDPQRNETILQIITLCFSQGTNVSFGKKTMRFTSDMFQISQKDKTQITNLYKNQCTKQFFAAMEKDTACYNAMVIGQKMNNTAYIIHLVDDWMRWRVEQYLIGNKGKKLSVTKWSQKHPHFVMLEKISSKLKRDTIAGVKSFSARICPKFEFEPVSVIEGSLQNAVDVIYEAITFVYRRSKLERNCPFQMDVCIGYGPFKNMMDTKDNDDDDDDDDVDDPNGVSVQKGHSVDIIGDIFKKLDNNKLMHHSEKDLRVNFDKTFKGFAEKAQYKQALPRNNRWITFVDERVEKKEDEKEQETLMFTPPSDCDTVPKDAVNEWYFASTATCLIPNMNYKVQKMMHEDMGENVSNVNEQKEQSQKEKLESAPIASKATGSVLVLSFHVKEEEAISCYMYVMGQYIRFMPRDVIDILPELFDKNAQNIQFVKEMKERIEKVQKVREMSENAQEIERIEEMESKLVDKYFDAFRASYATD